MLLQLIVRLTQVNDAERGVRTGQSQLQPGQVLVQDTGALIIGCVNNGFQMKELQIRFANNPNNDSTDLIIIVNDIIDINSQAYIQLNGFDNLYHSAKLVSEEAINEILLFSYQAVSEFLCNFSFSIKKEEWDFEITISIDLKEEFAEIRKGIEVFLRTDENKWAKPYSISDYFNTFFSFYKTSALNIPELYILEPDSYDTTYKLFLDITNDLQVINYDIQNIINTLDEVFVKTVLQLYSELDNSTLVTYFRFPINIKTAAKQYLIYFSQFMMDSGIDIDVELKEELNNTLFKIISKGNDVPLEKIKEALIVYLNAPSLPDFDYQASKVNDISVMQWQANVMHLKSQLTLALAELQLKDATIQALQLSNYQLSTTQKIDDSEEIFKGLVSVKKYESNGLSINIPEILRRLKRRFNK